MSDMVQGLKKAFESQEWIDKLAEPVQKAVHGIFKSGGAVGKRMMDFLHGVWLGHPLHPVLTDIPIGAWTAAIALDVMEAGSGSRGVGKAADTAVAVGVAGAAGAAVAGITDWMHLQGESRRTGFTHAALNTLALGFFIASLAARKDNKRGLGRSLALSGFSIAGFSAFLGGDLVFRQKIGVNHAPEQIDTPEFVPVIPIDQLSENNLTRAMLNDTPVVLLRRGDRIFALAETCAHLAGPLANGSLDDSRPGEPAVICPWHGSTFNMASGDVIHGPSAYPQPCFEARVRDGMVELRHSAE